MRALPAVVAVVAVAGLLAWTFWPAPGAPTATPSASGTNPGATSGAATPRAFTPRDPRSLVLRGDHRIAELVYDCAKTGWYDRDTSDTIPILIEKLQHGQVAPLQRAKEELAQLGEPALVEIARLLHKSFSDPMAAPVLQNTLDVASMASGDIAHDLLIECLDHPRDAVRATAADALARKHARADDYDRFVLQLEAESPEGRRNMVRALAAADLPRAQRQFVTWICANEQQGLWPDMLPSLWSATDAEVGARAKACWRDALPSVRTALLLLAIRAGDTSAPAVLQEELRALEPERRSRAISAAIELEHWDDVGNALLGDGNVAIRELALSGLARATDRTRVLPWIVQVSQEPAGPLAESALTLLLAWHDAASEDRLLADLEAAGAAFERALRLLSRELESRPDLAQRVWMTLRARADAERALPLAQRLPTAQAIGLVPLAEAAQWLRAEALAAPLDTRVKELRAHEWLMIQASNTGAAGRAWLATQFDGEQDPLRRIDLVWAVSAQRCTDDGSTCAGRDTLLRILDDENTQPFEVLYVASRLVRLGSSQIVAPRLKHALLRVKEPEARLAFECLLWTWY